MHAFDKLHEECGVFGIYLKDGKTGVVYQKNDLVAVTSTDKNGDASFLACTEAPGRFYNYENKAEKYN